MSAALDVQRGVGVRVLRDTIRAIDQLHGDGALPRIPIRRRNIPGAYGQFARTLADQAKFIEVSPRSPWPHMTTAHEIGHFLDHSGIPGSVTFRSPSNQAAGDWRRAARQSRLFHEIEQTWRPISTRHADYLNSDREMWARSYAQWVALRSGDPAMLAELRRAQQGAVTQDRRQWLDDDFEPIGRALDDMFRYLGWIAPTSRRPAAPSAP